MSANLYMDAVITPHRSLSRKGFAVLLGVIIAFNLAIAMLMIVLKAFPVPIFLGADVLAVWIAFRASYRGAGQAERVQVTADEVRVAHEWSRGRRTVWRSPTAFTRVVLDAPSEHEARVRLQMSGKVLTVGHALSPLERTDFASALEKAIAAARAERH
jgi:uncharacterized membrane protein